jgi:hypothetical protein
VDHSDHHATILHPPMVGTELVRVTVDGERRARVRTMRLELLEVVDSRD